MADTRDKLNIETVDSQSETQGSESDVILVNIKDEQRRQKEQILSSLSFLTLTTQNKAFLHDFFYQKTQVSTQNTDYQDEYDVINPMHMGMSVQSDDASFDSHDDQTEELIEELIDAFRNRRFLSLTFDYHLKKVSSIDPVLLQYKDLEELSLLQEELYHAYYVLYTQYQIELTETKKDSAAAITRLNQVQKCADLIAKIQFVCDIKEFGANLDTVHDQNIAQLKNYAVLGAAIDLSKVITRGVGKNRDDAKENIQSIHKTVVEGINVLNWERLYWVWGAAFLADVANLVYRVGSRHHEKSLDVINAPAPITGAVSYTLYFTRFLSNSLLIFKPKWMMSDQEYVVKTRLEELQKSGAITKEEENYVWTERKWMWLNDLIWGPTNFFCYFWLNFSNDQEFFSLKFGTWGDLLSCFLLGYDLSLSLLRYRDKKEKHEAFLQEFDRDINLIARDLHFKIAMDDSVKNLANLENLINAGLAQSQLDNTYRIKLNRLQALINDRKSLVNAWKVEEGFLLADIQYALGLSAGLVLLCFLAVMPVGSTICVSFTVAYMFFNEMKVLNNSQQIYKELQADLQELRKQQLVSQEGGQTNLIVTRQIETLEKRLQYQAEMVKYYKMKATGTLVLSLLIPLTILSAVFFPPVSGVLITLWIFAYATPAAFNFIMRRYVKPQQKDFFEHTDEELTASLLEPSFDESSLDLTQSLIAGQGVSHEEHGPDSTAGFELTTSLRRYSMLQGRTNNADREYQEDDDFGETYNPLHQK